MFYIFYCTYIYIYNTGVYTGVYYTILDAMFSTVLSSS